MIMIMIMIMLIMIMIMVRIMLMIMLTMMMIKTILGGIIDTWQLSLPLSPAQIMLVAMENGYLGRGEGHYSHFLRNW